MRLDHTHIGMPEGGRPAAEHFWVAVLGFVPEPVPTELHRFGVVWFRHGSLTIHIGPDKTFKPHPRNHTALVVDDVEALARRVAEHGFDVKWDTLVPDRRRFFTADPFGNRFEFLRAGDGFTERPATP